MDNVRDRDAEVVLVQLPFFSSCSATVKLVPHPSHVFPLSVIKHAKVTATSDVVRCTKIFDLEYLWMHEKLDALKVNALLTSMFEIPATSLLNATGSL